MTTLYNGNKVNDYIKSASKILSFHDIAKIVEINTKVQCHKEMLEEKLLREGFKKIEKIAYGHNNQKSILKFYKPPSDEVKKDIENQKLIDRSTIVDTTSRELQKRLEEVKRINPRNSKLTYEQATEIREIYSNDLSCTYKELADKYDVTIGAIAHVITGKTFIEPKIEVQKDA